MYMLVENKKVKKKMFVRAMYNKVGDVEQSCSGQHIPMLGSWKVDQFGLTTVF